MNAKARAEKKKKLEAAVFITVAMVGSLEEMIETFKPLAFDLSAHSAEVALLYGTYTGLAKTRDELDKAINCTVAVLENWKGNWQ